MNFLAIVIAAIASMIAYGQYRTAREKLILDLFDKRIDVYKSVMNVIEQVGSVNRMGIVFSEDIKNFDKALYPMTYLFGEDVVKAARELRQSLIDLMGAGGQAKFDTSDLVLNAVINEKPFNEAAIAYYNAASKFQDVLRPYITMDQKLPRSASRWLRDVWSRVRN